tara:strand:- start:2293 stop:3819 length:1527 start_codon:yes stop_codon:yes gene_type:complete
MSKTTKITIVFSTKEIKPDFITHLKTTCGVKDVEILAYENKGTMSLTEVYNKGLKDSKNDIVVFTHDDVILGKNGWGRRLIKRYNDSEFGLLGVAGTTHMASTGRWWEDQSKMVGRVSHSHEGRTWENKYSNTFPNQILEVCCLDGVWFSCHKQRIKKDFDESIPGFHFYDVDFTFGNHLKGVKTGVIFDVKLTHKSIGMTNDEWEKNKRLFVEKYAFIPDTNDVCLPYHITPKIFYRNKNINIKNSPKVSVIIPTINNLDLLFKCVDSILNNSDYKNLDILIADTGSDEENLEEMKSRYTQPNIKIIEYDYYHFSEINNDVVKNHVSEDTDLLLFSNNDIELINDTISEMVNLWNKNKKRCGTVGARLHFGDNTLQHAGIFLYGKKEGENVQVGLTHHGHKSSYTYPFENVTGVIGSTAAFLLIEKKLFKSIGMFNEEYLDCLEDVELNLACILNGRINCLAGNGVAYHYESKTRKTDGQIKQEDFGRMVQYIKSNPKLGSTIQIIG